MTRVAILCVLFLTACGVDGPPERPETNAANISVSGDARIGIATE